MTIVACEKPNLDLGIVKASDKFAYVEFTVSNIGVEDLNISKVSLSCGCMTSEIPKSLKPNESGVIKIKMNLENKSGVVNKSASVYGNFEHPLYLSFKMEIV